MPVKDAQAGLPLLNGGAILGHIVGGLFTIGMAMFSLTSVSGVIEHV